ncbi:MAG: hypothetical protein NTV22_07680 [bacterium]|nr:hypothetical protein [bacterium]
MRMRTTNNFWCLFSAIIVSCAVLTALAAIPTTDVIAASEVISKVSTPAAKAYLEKEFARILDLPDEAKKEQEFQKFLAGLHPGAESAAAPTPVAPATPVTPAKQASGASQVGNSKIVDAKTQQEAAKNGDTG